MFWSVLQKPLDPLEFECDFCVPEEISFKMHWLSKKKKSLFEIENKTWKIFWRAVVPRWMTFQNKQHYQYNNGNDEIIFCFSGWVLKMFLPPPLDLHIRLTTAHYILIRKVTPLFWKLLWKVGINYQFFLLKFPKFPIRLVIFIKVPVFFLSKEMKIKFSGLFFRVATHPGFCLLIYLNVNLTLFVFLLKQLLCTKLEDIIQFFLGHSSLFSRP